MKKSGVFLLFGLLIVGGLTSQYTLAIQTDDNAQSRRISLVEGPEAVADETDTSSAPTAEPKRITPADIVIPESVGRVKESFTGTSNRIIIHIQDAHCNYEAQNNIAKILEMLYTNNNLEFVGLEGADGRIDTSWFKAFPDAEIRKEVADYFMKKGEITGAEFLSITTDYPIYLYGVEQREYYIENLNAFTAGYKIKPAIEKYCEDAQGILEELKRYIYSKDLKSFDGKVVEYEDKKIDFTAYVSFLGENAKKRNISLKEYPNVELLMQTMEKEKGIDFAKVNTERTDLIELLEQKLPKDRFSELVVKSLAFKVSKISQEEFYGYLKALSREASVDMSKLPNLVRFTEYIELHGQMSAEKLFDEMDDVQWAIRSTMYTDEDQRMLDTLLRNSKIIYGLANIKLTNKEYRYFDAHRQEFTSDYYAPFIQRQVERFGLSYQFSDDYGIILNNLAELERFYTVALKRDNALMQNTLEVMDKEGESICALITGGFHTEGITRLAREKNISYMVIYPVITEKVESPYLQVLLNQALPTGALDQAGVGQGKKE